MPTSINAGDTVNVGTDAVTDTVPATFDWAIYKGGVLVTDGMEDTPTDGWLANGVYVGDLYETIDITVPLDAAGGTDYYAVVNEYNYDTGPNAALFEVVAAPAPPPSRRRVMVSYS